MRKKLIVLVVALVAVFGLSACDPEGSVSCNAQGCVHPGSPGSLG